MNEITNIISVLFVAILCAFSTLQAQDSIRTPYFPYQSGDFWVNEIYIAGQYETDERIDIISDSAAPNGDYVFTVSSDRGQPEELIYNFKIDSTNNIYSDLWYDKGDWLKIFDFSKNVGETWILEQDSLTPSLVQYELAEVVLEYKSKIFGDSTTVKEVRYARTDNNSTSTQEGYGRFYVWWSEKFGMLEKRSLELPGIEPVLKGARIGNTIYGDTTANLPPVSIEEKGSEGPSNITLHQNYPNPFNPSTSIRF